MNDTPHKTAVPEKRRTGGAFFGQRQVFFFVMHGSSFQSGNPRAGKETADAVYTQYGENILFLFTLAISGKPGYNGKKEGEKHGRKWHAGESENHG